MLCVLYFLDGNAAGHFLVSGGIFVSFGLNLYWFHFWK